MTIKQQVGGRGGFVPETVTIRVINQTGGDLTIGQGARLNTLFDDGSALGVALDSTHGSQPVWGSLRNQIALHDSCAIGCILAEDIADGDTGLVHIAGVVTGQIAAALARGSRLHIDGTSGSLTGTLAAGDKCHAILLETTTNAALAPIMLDGMGTMGSEI